MYLCVALAEVFLKHALDAESENHNQVVRELRSA